MPEEGATGSIGVFEAMSLGIFVITLISFVFFLKIFRKKNIHELVLIKCSESSELEKPIYSEILANLEKIDAICKDRSKNTVKTKFWRRWMSKK